MAAPPAAQPAAPELSLMATDLDTLQSGQQIIEHSNAPKRAMPAYQYFAADQRKMLKGSDEKLSTGEMSKKIGAAWKELPDEEREPYLAKAAEDRLRYKNDLVGYVPPPKATKSGKRLGKDPKRPKKPKTAYLYFADQVRPDLMEANKGAGVTALAPMLAEAWRKITPEERQKYIDLATADKQRYDTEMLQYKPSATYLAARERFKMNRKAGQDGGANMTGVIIATTNAVPVDENATRLQEENKKLQQALKEKEKAFDKLTRECKKQETLIAKLQKKLDNVPQKKETEAERYLRWTKSVWGERGEKATPEMKRVHQLFGADGLAEFLGEMYKEQQSRLMKKGAAKRPADAAANGAKAKKGRPDGAPPQVVEVGMARPGMPPGPMAVSAAAYAHGAVQVQVPPPGPGGAQPGAAKRRGRPPGSKNKPKGAKDGSPLNPQQAVMPRA